MPKNSPQNPQKQHGGGSSSSTTPSPSKTPSKRKLQDSDIAQDMIHKGGKKREESGPKASKHIKEARTKAKNEKVSSFECFFARYQDIACRKSRFFSRFLVLIVCVLCSICGYITHIQSPLLLNHLLPRS